MAIRSTAPRNGDIVIRQDVQDGTPTFVLLTLPGADQLLVFDRETALAQAARFATFQRVNAWLIDGNGDFALIANCRGPMP